MDATNGWDAAYAMNLPQVNALLLQQYLKNLQQQPIHKPMTLRVILEVQQEYWILDVALGPPKLAFRADSESFTLEIQLLSGSLITFDPRSQSIHNAAQIRPVESKLTGPVSLAKTVGEVNELGRVVVDLGASAYAPSIAGVDAKSVLTTEIGLAVQTFFAANKTTYPLGAIASSGSLPACLKPTDFHFYTQRKAGANEACVLLLIRTDGAAGTVGPLPAYPLTDGHSAALIIARRAIGKLVVDRLNQAFDALRWRFDYQESDATWKVICTAGELNFGQFGKEERRNGASWSCDERTNAQEVRVPCNGFTVEPSQGVLLASWSPRHEQYWAEYREWGDIEPQSQTFRLSTTIAPTFRQAGTPQVNPVNDDVTFSGDRAYSMDTQGDPGFIDEILNRKMAVPDSIKGKLKDHLEPRFRDFRLPDVNAFALANLLFPAGHVVSLEEAAIPADLHLTGTLAQPIAVTPAETALTPGQSVRFSATIRSGAAGDVLWQKPRVGSIDEHGVYTAPTSVHDATVVVITAISRANAALIGSAMVLVYEPPAATGVAVTPAIAIVTPGHSVTLSTTDALNNPTAVTWELSPNVGAIARTWGQAEYVYTAPPTVAQVTEVIATARSTSQPTHRGTSRIRVTPQVAMAVSPSQASIKPGERLELRATADGVDSSRVCWAIFPSDAGTITTDDDRSRATFHAAPRPAPTDVKVVAYVIDGAAGMASANVTV